MTYKLYVVALCADCGGTGRHRHYDTSCSCCGGSGEHDVETETLVEGPFRTYQGVEALSDIYVKVEEDDS